MNASRHERLRDLLCESRGTAEERVARTETALDALTLARRGESDDDEHDPEGVPLSAEWSRLSGVLESARAELQQVEAALVRWERGDYGVCEGCGRAIPAERLEARPFSDRCVPCARSAGR